MTKLHPPIPLVISQSEYESKYKPAGWRVIHIGPTATWRQEWGEWEAIRDIVQNALDEAEKYYCGYDEEGLWIADKGKGLAITDFLLGPAKPKPHWARGQFGEGLKIAALALLRKGYRVRIETVGREVWMVFLEQDVNGKVQTLSALWRPDGTKKGTTFHIIGYRGPDYRELFAVNLPETSLLFSAPSPLREPIPRYNQLFDAGGKARIYCRDIYLKDIKSPFSYNRWGFELAPDRHGPKSEAAMWTEVGRLWACVNKEALLVRFLHMVKTPPDVEATETLNVNMNYMGEVVVGDTVCLYMDIMQRNYRVWERAWHRAMGPHTVLRTHAKHDNLVKHLGYKSIQVHWNVGAALTGVIKTDSDLLDEMSERLSKTVTVPYSELSDIERCHFRLAEAIAFEFYPTVKVKVGLIPPASDATRTAGVYEYHANRVTIDRSQLLSANDVFSTMVHELAHHMVFIKEGREKAEDLTIEHTRAIEAMAGRVCSAVARGRFDRFLEKCQW